MADFKIKSVDVQDAFVKLELLDPDGNEHQVKLDSMEIASLIGLLRSSLELALGHPAASSLGLPEIQHVQYVETPETGFFREGLYHEYPVPLNTTLGTELKAFGDRVEARNLAKTTNQPPGARKN